MWIISRAPMHHHALRRRSRVEGFTLIEILVVMVIIALVSGIALLSLGVLGADAGLKSEADGLSQTIELLSERAGLEGADYGLYFTPNGYQILRFNPESGVWELLDNDWRLQSHRFDSTAQQSLQSSNLDLKLVPLSADELKRLPRVGQSSPASVAVNPTTDPTQAASTGSTAKSSAAGSQSVVDDSEGRDERFNKAFDRDELRFLMVVPQIWILASGEISPFRWRLTRADRGVELTATTEGTLKTTELQVSP